MKNRIAIWASAGFLVAGFWALFAIATFPSTSERMRDVWTLISLTCPIAIAGMHHPISLYETLAANAVTMGWSVSLWKPCGNNCIARNNPKPAAPHPD